MLTGESRNVHRSESFGVELGPEITPTGVGKQATIQKDESCCMPPSEIATDLHSGKCTFFRYSLIAALIRSA